MDLEHDARINPDIDAEFREHSIRFMGWAVLHAHAVDRVTTLKHDLKVLEAGLDFAKRQEARANGIKMTEPMVANEVVTDESHQLLMKDLLVAQRDAGILAAGVETMRHRKDMLVGLGANWREEIRNDDSARKDAKADVLRKKLASRRTKVQEKNAPRNR